MLKSNQINEILDVIESIYPNASCELIYHNMFELIVCVSLSAQTTDASVNKVTGLLFSKYPTCYDLAKANQTDVENIIHNIGLSKNKSKNIINLSKVLVENFNGEVPSNYDDLVTLPGVGRKTANVVLSEGFKIPRIAVDTHVERVSKRLGVTSFESSVLDVENELMRLIPREKWHHSHHLLLFFGRYFCKAKQPNCKNCAFKNQCHKED